MTKTCARCAYYTANKHSNEVGICRLRPPIPYVVLMPMQHPISREVSVQPQVISALPETKGDSTCEAHMLKLAVAQIN